MLKLTTPKDKEGFLQAHLTRVLVEEAVFTATVIKHKVVHFRKLGEKIPGN